MKLFKFAPLMITLILTTGSHAKQEEVDPTDRSEMRHGLMVFSGPKRTILGVNDKNAIQRGKKVFKHHCQSCHGTSGKGDGPLAKKQKIYPTDLTKIAGQLPNHYLVIQINKGKNNMPSWKDLLSSKEVWDLTNYIQTLAK